MKSVNQNSIILIILCVGVGVWKTLCVCLRVCVHVCMFTELFFTTKAIKQNLKKQCREYVTYMMCII